MPAVKRFTTPPVLLAVSAAVSAAVLIAWQSHLTFLIDDWDLLLHRRGISADSLLDPHARHLIVGPAIVYKAIQATFGMDGRFPYAVASTGTFLASIVLLFIYLRRRVGDWLALAAVLPILFMGPAYEDLLSSFQICYFGSMAFGIGALLAIERSDRRGDVIACALLVASLAFAEIAFAFAAGVAVAIALDRGPVRRAWIVGIPLALYLVWYLVWGHSGSHLGPNSLSFTNVATSPAYVLDGFASSLGSVFGLGTPALFGGTGGLEWGRPLLVALVALAAVAALRSRFPVRTWLLVAVAVGVSFWLLTGANAALGRPPFASRYQYVGAVFVLMIAAEFIARWRPGWRPGWRALIAVFAVAGLATISNLSTLHQGYQALSRLSATVRGGLAGLEIGADSANPDLVLTQQNSDFNYFTWVDAGSYLSAVDKFGSPAYTQAELPEAPEPARIAADKVLAAALQLAFQPLSKPPAPGTTAPRLVGPLGAVVGRSPGCLIVSRVGGGLPVLALPPGGAILSAPPGAQAGLSLRRFAADSFPILAGTVHGSARLDIPEDRSNRPWELQLDPTDRVTVCGE
jgi:hypothetical protein